MNCYYVLSRLSASGSSSSEFPVRKTELNPLDTEIDWRTYLQQVKIAFQTYDYAQVKGDTGPVVYPAGHLYLYAGLKYLLGEDQVKNWQYVFGCLYLVQLAILLAIYRRCGSGKLPMLMLCLSKRLHSIYVLRLFNDPWAMTFVIGAIYCMLKRRRGWLKMSVLLLSIGLSIKMNVLLFMPAACWIWWEQQGLWFTAQALSFIAAFQMLIGFRFWWVNPRAYLQQSFDFGRQFDYRWTVNWRMISQITFDHPLRGRLLLGLHVITLLLWLWKRRNNKNPFLLMAECNLIGIICARTLHYQFYSWYHFTIPWLLWQCRGMPTWMRIGWYAVIEAGWNIYPSTPLSSSTLFIANSGLLIWPK